MHYLLLVFLLLPAGGLPSAVSSAVCTNNDCWCGSDATRAAYECKEGDAKYKCTNPGSTSYCAALTAKGFPLYSCLEARTFFKNIDRSYHHVNWFLDTYVCEGTRLR